MKSKAESADLEINEWFISEYKKSEKKMDMGKSCVRFNKLDNLPLDLIAMAIAKTLPDQYIEMYKRAISTVKKQGIKPIKYL